MARTGVEAKMPWRQVPRAVRREVEQRLGAPVARGARIWGGYGPAPTFRLALTDGRRAFFKAINADSNEFSRRALREEQRVYTELGGMLRAFIAEFYGEVVVEDWHGLLLEDLGPKSAPPWTPSLTRKVTHGLAAFHTATLDKPLPDWLSRPDTTIPTESWDKVVAQTDGLARLIALAGDHAADARRWLQAASPVIEAQMASPVLYHAPFALLHGDLRSDNLRWRNHLYLFDWPAITVGRAEWDMVAFAQTVTVEGGVLPEQVMAWYAERFAVDDAAVQAALAWWFAFFALRAWQDEIPGLPRLRRFQRQQLGVLAQWLARVSDLPAPEWVATLVDGLI